MTSESNRISAASVSYVDGVCRAWGWSWQEIGQADDDGIDGLAYLRTMAINAERPADRRFWKHEFTGGIIHVQIKTGPTYVTGTVDDSLKIKVVDLAAKREVWRRSPFPCALVYVQAQALGKVPGKAWWVDLKSSDAYSADGHILVPLKNRFQAGLECRRPFSRLAAGQHRALALSDIDMALHGSQPRKLNQMGRGLKWSAWEFYANWKASPVINPALGEIIVNRTGWAHITRPERPVPRIMTSFQLLPAAARIIEEVEQWRVLRKGDHIKNLPDGSQRIFDYLGITAMVKWPARATAEVMVILRRETILAASIAQGKTSDAMTNLQQVQRRIWFYSVYEPGRRKREH